MLVLLSGVSGSGKDTIKKELMKRMECLATMPSYTDRAPRAGEVEANVYNFVTTEEFEQKIKEEEFYEYSVHHEHFYGTSRKVLNERVNSGKIIVKDIDVNGTENLLKVLDDDLKIVTIFLRVPREELRERLENREGKEKIKEIELRLNRFDYEESKIGLYDYVLKNDDLEKTVQIIMTIIESEYKCSERLEA
ncbi:MAG: AAA family ATPase [Oscillospiraceae bacterium]|nr:AAA family ATPase [Oscillospiraceae bacterium]